MPARVTLPGRPDPVEIPDPGWASSYPPPRSRRVYAAAHVAARPDGSIDWPSTMAFREHLWAHGFGVAEAMDTAQRGMGLSAASARELIARSSARAAERGAAIVVGAGTDDLPAAPHPLGTIAAAYTDQITSMPEHHGTVIVMASRALAASARSAADYLDVYQDVLQAAAEPVLLHWLGEAFDPALRGYWGADGFPSAARTVLDLIERTGDRIAGIKLSVLDAAAERDLRKRLPAGVRLYTGDDFHYADLIRGDEEGHSDALLGAFAAVTAPAAAALHALDAGDLAGYDEAIGPTVGLSRVIFAAPTYYYKVGVAFLAWLNGLQPHFSMLGGLQRHRDTAHLADVFEQAAKARALLDPPLAAARMTALVAGTAAA